MSYFFKHFEQIAAGMELYHALAKFASSQNLRRKVFGDQDSFPGAHFLARPNQRFPSILSDLPGEKDLYLTRAMLAPPIEPGGKNARVI